MRFILKNLYWCILFVFAFGATPLWVLAFLWTVANEPTPIAPYKPIHPVSNYRGLEVVNKPRIPSVSEIDSVKAHALAILGMDGSYIRKGE